MSIAGIVGGAVGSSHKKEETREVFSFISDNRKNFKSLGIEYPDIHTLPIDKIIHFPVPDPFLVELKINKNIQVDPSATKYTGTIGFLDQISMVLLRSPRNAWIFRCKKIRLRIPGNRPLYIFKKKGYELEFHSVKHNTVPILKKLEIEKTDAQVLQDILGEELEIGNIVLHRTLKSIAFGRIDRFTKNSVLIDTFWEQDPNSYPLNIGNMKRCKAKNLLKIDEGLKDRVVMLKLSS